VEEIGFYVFFPEDDDISFGGRDAEIEPCEDCVYSFSKDAVSLLLSKTGREYLDRRRRG